MGTRQNENKTDVRTFESIGFSGCWAKCFTFSRSTNVDMSEAKLTIKIENTKPIEITDFTEAFESLGNQYYKFLSESEHFKLSKETKLYVKEIRTGSIITELTDMVPAIIPFVEYSNSVIEFTNYLKSAYDYFAGKVSERPKEFDLKDCNNLSNVIKPVAKDNGSNITFTGDFNFGDVTINMNLSSVEANAIQNGINRYKSELNEQKSNVHGNVLFYWDSAKYDEKSKAIDRGFIDAISDQSLRVTFDDDRIKYQMLDMEDNPFHFMFLVDVEVLTVNNDIPKMYKVLRLNDTLAKE